MPALYRKWRSRSFDDLYGQEHVVRTLRNAVMQGRVAHAYLFTGPRGTGKTSMARILAKAVNCLNPQEGSPCNVCEMCLAANEGRALDVIEIDAASHTGVDSVRELRERVAYAAGEGSYKVYIVDEVHRLSPQAFDAFLKTLEEPPSHVIFVFASTEPHKVPETITSRCQRFDFRRIPPDIARGRLAFVAEQEGLQIGSEALDLIAQQARGSLRDALGLLDQAAAYTGEAIGDSEVRAALGLADAGLVGALSDAIIVGDVAAGLERFQRFVDAGGDARQLTRQMVDYWRALLLAASGAAVPELALDPALVSSLASHRVQVRETQAVRVLQALVDQEFSAKFSVPAQLPFEVALVRAALAVRGEPAHEPVSVAGEAQAAPQPVVEPEKRPGRTPNGVASAPAKSGGSRAGQSGVKDLLAGIVPRPPAPSAAAKAEAAPPAEPAVTPGAASAAPRLDLAAVEHRWGDIIRLMRERDRRIEAILKSGFVLSVARDEVTIGFPYPFHRDFFNEAAKRQIVEGVTGEVLGGPYRVRFTLATKEQMDELRARGALQEDDGFMEEAAEMLRTWHAKQLGGGGS